MKTYHFFYEQLLSLSFLCSATYFFSLLYGWKKILSPFYPRLLLSPIKFCFGLLKLAVAGFLSIVASIAVVLAGVAIGSFSVFL